MPKIHYFSINRHFLLTVTSIFLKTLDSMVAEMHQQKDHASDNLLKQTGKTEAGNKL